AEEATYAAQLATLIQNTNIGSHVSLITEAIDADGLLSRADALLLTARSDTPIDAAVQALRHGIPVLAFENANDMAHALADHALAESCIAPYLDTETLTYKLQQILTAGPAAKS